MKRMKPLKSNSCKDNEFSRNEHIDITPDESKELSNEEINELKIMNVLILNIVMVMMCF